MIIYRVHDDEWEQVMGEGQVCEFAVSQVQNCPDDYLVENLENVVDTPHRVGMIAVEVAKNKPITFEQAKMLLNARGYDLEEIGVY